jgi:hypothetical protein
MSHHHRPVADLSSYPAFPAQLVVDEGVTMSLTIGDLHGNVMKAIYALIAHGMMKLQEDQYEDQYNELHQIYSQLYNGRYATRKEEVESDLDRFQAILDAAEMVVPANFRLRFIGDTLSDRGANDWLTLLFFRKLHQSGLDFKITFSNHDANFIAFVEGRTEFSGGIHISQSNSFNNLLRLIDNEIVTKDEVIQLYKKSVAGHFELAALEIVRIDDNDEDTESATLFTHGSALVQSIFYAAEAFAVPDLPSSLDEFMRDLTRQKLQGFIDAMNHKFVERAINLTLLHPDSPVKVDTDRHPEDLGKGQTFIPSQCAFTHVTWGRHHLQTDFLAHARVMERLSLTTVHGHTGESQPGKLLPTLILDSNGRFDTKDLLAAIDCNLDTNIGRPDHNEGVFPCFVSGGSVQKPPPGFIYLGLDPLGEAASAEIEVAGDQVVDQPNCLPAATSSAGQEVVVTETSSSDDPQQQVLAGATSSQEEDSSSPEDGLLGLLDIWNSIVAGIPEADPRHQKEILVSMGAHLGNPRSGALPDRKNLCDALNIDRNKALRIFAKVVVNALVIVALCATVLGAVALGFLFCRRKKETGCALYFGQTKSAEKAFRLHREIEALSSHKEGEPEATV